MPLTSYKTIIPSSWNKKSYQTFIKKLKSLQDLKYKEFNSKIINTNYEIIGIKVPIISYLIKCINKDNIIDFLNNIEHNYFEETLLEGIAISYIDQYDTFINYLSKFLDSIDNWATCDICICRFNIIKKNKDKFISIINKLIKDKNPYYVRVGVVSILNHYLEDEDYLEYIFKVIEEIENKDYYVEMSIAWLISYLYIYYKDRTIKFLANNKLNSSIQNKAINKIRESNKVSKVDKKDILKYKKN